MSSSISAHAVARCPLGLDAQQLLLVVPLVQRLGLVEALVALQADEPGARSSRRRDLASWVLPVPAGPSTRTGLPQPIGQVHDAGDALVGEVVDACAGRRGRRARTRSGSAIGRSYRRHLTGAVKPDASAAQPRIWPVALDDVLGGGQLAQAHRAAGVELLGADADLGAEAELLAVDEAGRGVDEHRGGVDLAGEAVGRREVAGDDGLGVTRAVAGDVVDRLVERVDDPRPPASGRGTRWRSRRRWRPWRRAASARARVVADQLDAVERRRPPRAGSCVGHRCVHEQATRPRCTPTGAASWR